MSRIFLESPDTGSRQSDPTEHHLLERLATRLQRAGYKTRFRLAAEPALDNAVAGAGKEPIRLTLQLVGAKGAFRIQVRLQADMGDLYPVADLVLAQQPALGCGKHLPSLPRVQLAVNNLMAEDLDRLRHLEGELRQAAAQVHPRPARPAPFRSADHARN
jgi:hypothetical protein